MVFVMAVSTSQSLLLIESLALSALLVEASMTQGRFCVGKAQYDLSPDSGNNLTSRFYRSTVAILKKLTVRR